MNRDMSYDLDGAFALRDAGEVQNLTDAAKTVVLRTPGISPVFKPNEIALTSDEDHLEKPKDLAGMEVSLPIIGNVNLLHVGVAVLAGYMLCKFLKK